jgi:hypothetical protein
MKVNEPSLPFIFYLTLDESLPKTYYIFDQYLKESGFILVPVKIDQLQSLVASSEQEQVVVLCSVSDAKEYKSYNDKIRGFLKYILKSKRLTFIHLSSFSKINDQKKFVMQKNYFFMKYPLNAKDLSLRISKYHALKKDQLTVWPGGRRATLGSGVV